MSLTPQPPDTDVATWREFLAHASVAYTTVAAILEMGFLIARNEINDPWSDSYRSGVADAIMALVIVHAGSGRPEARAITRVVVDRARRELAS